MLTLTKNKKPLQISKKMINNKKKKLFKKDKLYNRQIRQMKDKGLKELKLNIKNKSNSLKIRNRKQKANSR